MFVCRRGGVERDRARGRDDTHGAARRGTVLHGRRGRIPGGKGSEPNAVP